MQKEIGFLRLLKHEKKTVKKSKSKLKRFPFYQMLFQFPVMEKREDIQWLRALAIVAVLGFHIWPETFSFGYLGVDM